MKDIREVYPDSEAYGSFWASGDYTPMLESLGQIVARADQNDYQGDSMVLFRDGSRFGYLVFGWGSCSGCDALQACGSYEEIDSLRASLSESIRWGTAQEIREYLEQKDWETEYMDRAMVSEFISKAIPVLASEEKGEVTQ